VRTHERVSEWRLSPCGDSLVKIFVVNLHQWWFDNAIRSPAEAGLFTFPEKPCAALNLYPPAPCGDARKNETTAKKSKAGRLGNLHAGIIGATRPVVTAFTVASGLLPAQERIGHADVGTKGATEKEAASGAGRNAVLRVPAVDVLAGDRIGLEIDVKRAVTAVRVGRVTPPAVIARARYRRQWIGQAAEKAERETRANGRKIRRILELDEELRAALPGCREISRIIYRINDACNRNRRRGPESKQQRRGEWCPFQKSCLSLTTCWFVSKIDPLMDWTPDSGPAKGSNWYACLAITSERVHGQRSIPAA